MTKRVFFVQRDMRFSTGAASEFGTVEFLTDSLPSPLNTNQVIEELNDALTIVDFDPKNDYIAMTGPVIGLSFVLFLIGSRFGSAQVLVFDSRYSRYRPSTLSDVACDLAARAVPAPH